MKKWTKFLAGGALFLALCAGMPGIPGMAHKTNATEGIRIENPDVIPPQGKIIVNEATYKNGIYYTNLENVSLTLEAQDNVSDPENLKMIVSDEMLDAATIENDESWQNFNANAITSWSLSPDNEGKNMIYLYLKDEAGNISPAFTVGTADKYTVTYATNETGVTNMPPNKEIAPGLAFNVAIQEPKLEGMYFHGWSFEGPDGTVQVLSDELIEAKYVKGDLTLYAIFTYKPPYLSDVVKIGDYVEFPVSYENIASYNGGNTSTYTGWRVLNINHENVQVDLVSAGTPLQYYHDGAGSISVDKLTNDFFGTEYKASGFKSLDLETAFAPGMQYVKKVSAMDKTDLNNIVGFDIAYQQYTSRFGSLATNGSYYWLASVYPSYAAYLWYVAPDGYVVSSTDRSFRSASQSFSNI